MSFYPDLIEILSRFLETNFIQILYRFLISSRFLETHFIQILSRFYPNFIWIKSGSSQAKIEIKSG